MKETPAQTSQRRDFLPAAIAAAIVATIALAGAGVSLLSSRHAAAPPALPLLDGGREEWLAAGLAAQTEAIREVVREAHPEYSELELAFQAGFISGRIDLIYEQTTTRKLAKMLDELITSKQ